MINPRLFATEGIGGGPAALASQGFLTEDANSALRGSAVFIITAHGALTNAGQAMAGGPVSRKTRREHGRVRPGELRGHATFRVEATGHLSSAWIEPPHLVVQSGPEVKAAPPLAPVVVRDSAVLRPVVRIESKTAVVMPAPVTPDGLSGAAVITVSATGRLTSGRVLAEFKPHVEVDLYDDTEELVLAMLVLRRAA